jgi:hypothetical protein
MFLGAAKREAWSTYLQDLSDVNGIVVLEIMSRVRVYCTRIPTFLSLLYKIWEMGISGVSLPNGI